MSFTAKDVAKLRAATSAGMMDCKKALVETNGDMDEAIAFLRKKGLSAAAKKADNIAAEGIVACAIASDNKSGAIVEVNSQTDFVAKNDDFKAFVAEVAKAALENKTKTIDELLKAPLAGSTVADEAINKTATIGEKIDVRRVQFFETSDGLVGQYVHPVGNKVGALVELSGTATPEQASDVCMHVAASNPAPEFVSKDAIPKDEVEKETKIEMGKDDIKGKPPEIAEKIVSGRVNKLLNARVLLEQPFIKNPDQSVAQFLDKASIKSFVRFNLGEGIEKKVDDFAAEVASMTGN